MNSFISHFKTFSPLLKLLFLFIISIISLIIISIIGFLIALPIYPNDVILVISGNYNLDNAYHIAILKYMQIITHLGLFIIPAFLFAYMFENGYKNYFLFKRKNSLMIILIGCFIMVLAVPFVSFLGDINSKMIFPESLKFLENWMKNSEDNAEILVNAFISQVGWKHLLINLLMIAVIPAIGEELIFRGIVLRKIFHSNNNIHLAVFISAIIFSAFHFQFYGFLPRLFLGILLGYMFVFTGSLILPILAHFANNALAVLVSYLDATNRIEYNLDTFGNLNNKPLQMIIVTLILFFVILMFWYINKKTNINFKKI